MSILPGRWSRGSRRLVVVSAGERVPAEREPSAAELAELEAEVPLLLAEAELILLDAGVPAALALARVDEVAERRVLRGRGRLVGGAGFPLEVA